MCLVDPGPRSLHGIGLFALPGVEQLDELRQDEGPFDACARNLHGRDGVLQLEPDDEVDDRKIVAPEAACPVRRDVEPEHAGLAHRAGQWFRGTEVERPVRADLDGDTVGGALERRRREHAPEPIAGADKSNFQPA